MSQVIEQLLVLIGLTFGQAMDHRVEMDIPVQGVIAVYGQNHYLHFPEQDETQAMQSISSTLAMHGRDIEAYAVVEPGVAQNRVERIRIQSGSPAGSAVVFVEVRQHGQQLVVTTTDVEVNGAFLSGETLSEAMQIVSGAYSQEASRPQLRSGKPI